MFQTVVGITHRVTLDWSGLSRKVLKLEDKLAGESFEKLLYTSELSFCKIVAE